MDIRQIEIFVAIMERGSLTEAAKSLGITQPAVSGALSRLERHIGFSLFRRDGRQIVPTAEAALLHEEASRALNGVAQLDHVVADITETRRGRLVIASNPGPGISWLPGIAAAFRFGRPDVTVRFLTRSSREVRSLVAGRALDMGLAEPPFDGGDSIMRRYRFATVAVLPASHRLCGHHVITPDLLNDEDLIAMVPSHSTAPTIAKVFEAAGARRRVVAECEFFATALSMARHGGGVCLVDPISAAEAAGPDLVVRPLTPTVVYEIAVLRPTQGSMSLLAVAFAASIDRFLSPFLIDD
jgi:DNA-binding transcriptional LysR family regulator